MSTLGERIKYAREEKGLLQNDLAKLIGVKSSGVISNWEKDLNKPDAEKIVKLCNVLDISASFLLDYYGKSTFSFETQEVDHIKKYRSLDPYGQETVSYILDREVKRVSELADLKEKIPNILLEAPTNHTPVRYISYHQRTASAGNGQIVFEDMPVDRIEIPDIPKYKRVSYAIGVNGQSMEPLYNDGDILLIEPTCQIEAGEIGIFIVDGEAFVKKLGEGELISLNKGYPNITLTEYSNCMGRVVDKLHKAELL